ncbi:RNI-like protein [Linnemannia elongata AG-77]|uniref:RNI-like protein n=1 Tax=Linnemannia elongata AG-77 TaxID=1314771 RepID=A0A197JHB3_9FUNG|nr:RNI-like protein [Linnemannia elongata AG-77]
MELPFLITPLSFPGSPMPTLTQTQPTSRSPFMLPELDRLIASHLDRPTLASATRVSKQWHSIFTPFLWKRLSLQHLSEDDDDSDEDFGFFSYSSRSGSPRSSGLPSLPSSCSSNWSSLSTSSPTAVPCSIGVICASSPTFPASLSTTSGTTANTDATIGPKLTLAQHAFLNSSRNKALKGLRHFGPLVHELTATGITDQEMGVISVLCTNLRVLELIGGRYSVENLTELFQRRQGSIQTVRFRSCVLLKDIFRPMIHLSNLREFELYGSFVGNTITSPYFFERDLIPMLGACPRLRSILLEKVYIVDQQIEHGGWDTGGGWGGGGSGRGGGALSLSVNAGGQSSNHDGTISIPASLLTAQQESATATATPSLSLSQSTSTSLLSAQLKSSAASTNANPLRSPSSLQSFTLDCGEIPESVIMTMLTYTPKLDQLALNWSRELTDFSLSSLQYICPHLTQISLSHSLMVTAEGFMALFRSYPSLVSIDISHNILSDAVLEELARSCRSLRQLNINSCQNVTDLGIQAILLNCAHLASFSLRFITGLSCLLFDDIVTTDSSMDLVTGSPPTSMSFSFSSSPPPSLSFVSRTRLPSFPRAWACRETLQALHLPDLVSPNKTILAKYHHQQTLLGHRLDSDPLQPLRSDEMIQSRLQQLDKVKHLTIGGHSLDLTVVLDGLHRPYELESLRITKLKRTMTMQDAHWLLDIAAPNLQKFFIPMFGNRSVTEWIEARRPGLLAHEK